MKLSTTVMRRLLSLPGEAIERGVDGASWLRARRLFQRSGLFAALPLTGRVLEIEGDLGHLAEAAVHHIPNRRCVIVDSGRDRRHLVDRRVRRRKFHRVCAAPECLPFADGAFDAAWTTFALARLEPARQARVLAEMARVVRPGGTLVAIERVPETILGRILGPLSGALAFRSAAEWRAELPRQGWRIEAEQAFGGMISTPSCRTFVCRRL